MVLQKPYHGSLVNTARFNVIAQGSPVVYKKKLQIIQVSGGHDDLGARYVRRP